MVWEPGLSRDVYAYMLCERAAKSDGQGLWGPFAANHGLSAYLEKGPGKLGASFPSTEAQ